MAREPDHRWSDLVDPAAAGPSGGPAGGDVPGPARDGGKLPLYADELLEGATNLLGLQLSLASHRTAEVMRVLTIFSVSFLPLTFLVGVYGMNFRHLPELEWRWGHAAVWAVMLAVTALIFPWFKRQGWLR